MRNEGINRLSALDKQTKIISAVVIQKANFTLFEIYGAGGIKGVVTLSPTTNGNKSHQDLY